jgi:hypothetical protein
MAALEEIASNPYIYFITKDETIAAPIAPTRGAAGLAIAAKIYDYVYPIDVR